MVNKTSKTIRSPQTNVTLVRVVACEGRPLMPVGEPLGEGDLVGEEVFVVAPGFETRSVFVTTCVGLPGL